MNSYQRAKFNEIKRKILSLSKIAEHEFVINKCMSGIVSKIAVDRSFNTLYLQYCYYYELFGDKIWVVKLSKLRDKRDKYYRSKRKDEIMNKAEKALSKMSKKDLAQKIEENIEEPKLAKDVLDEEVIKNSDISKNDIVKPLVYDEVIKVLIASLQEGERLNKFTILHNTNIAKHNCVVVKELSNDDKSGTLKAGEGYSLVMFK